MVGCSDRRIVSTLGGALGLAVLLTIFAPPAGTLAQEPEEPAPEAQIEDPELRGLHARMQRLQEQMQEVRARKAERRRELLGEDAARTLPHGGRHAMHLRGLGGGRDMGMGMGTMRGRGMMLGRTMSGRQVMGQRMADVTMPRWCPSGMGRGMCRGMSRQRAAPPAERGSAGGDNRS